MKEPCLRPGRGFYIEIDFIFNDITAQIVVAKSPLMRFVAMLPDDDNI